MNKKVKTFLIIGIAFILVLSLYFYLSQPEKIEIKNGKFFDESGKELGLCEIKSTLNRLADVPKYTSYYYDLDNNLIGTCKGDGIGCFTSLENEPTICNPITLQKSCDKVTHPTGFGATAKYKCIVN